jgi:alpha-tubulin suppressor-like RCC1 family protein
MAKITANNIFTGAITSDKLDSSVASNLATANNANVVATIASTVAAAAFSTANNLSSILANSAPIITSITIADSSYNALDDTAANTTGGYCIITGSGFVSTPTVVFGTTSAPAVSFINSTTLRAQIPALTAASYPVYVVNSNGGTAIRVNGVTTSSFPAWGTAAALANTAANTAFSVSLSANSDSNITYSNTTSLPAGTTLASNGYFSGTVTIGTETTYSFDVKATDAENQDATRTFSLTVTVTLPRKLYITGSVGGLTGAGFSSDATVPTQLGSEYWKELTKNVSHFNNRGGIKQDGTLWAWGANGYGALGLNNGAFNTISSPVQVGSLTTWSKINSIGPGGFLAIKNDGTLWAWGSNSNGQLGNNSSGDVSSPTQIGSNTNWSKIAGFSNGALAIKTDGTLWAWGYNEAGELGQNNRIHRSSPVQVGSNTNWSEVAGSYSGFYAITTNGELWACGANYVGQLGTNDRVLRSNPIQIGSSSDWSKLLVDGGSWQASIKTDGTLWTWGAGYYGNLGLNQGLSTATYRSSPTQVGSSTDWLTGGGSYQALAIIKTNGTLWTVGYNGQGQLGFGNFLNKSSPTQVGSSADWTEVYGSQNGFFFISK